MMAERRNMGAKKKDPNAVALGSKGGKERAKRLSADEIAAIGRKGGKARLDTMTAAQRKAIARKAVNARWAKAKKQEGK
jgi:hypothetical protein